MTSVYEDDGAVWWTGPLAIDADGAADAYHPDGKSGRDYLANAGGPGNWYGIIVDAHGQPVIQGPGDPCPGFYVSPTALQDRSKNHADPRRYVDSALVPYVSIPKDAVGSYDLRLGDVALVYSKETGRMSAAIVADIGPRGKYGEGSVALAIALGLPSSARKGGTSSGVTVVVFKRTGRGWPLTNAEVAQEAQDAFQAGGGDFDRFR